MSSRLRRLSSHHTPSGKSNLDVNSMQSVRAVGQLVRNAARRALVSRALILVYHRVTPLDFDPEWLAVHPGRFGEQLDVLRRHYNVLSVPKLHECMQKGKVPRKAVAVTFDDGYADNLLDARPLLERYDVPATCFVTTGKLDQSSEFWWDELEGLLLETPKLPAVLSLELNGNRYCWPLDEGSESSTQLADRDDRNWNVLQQTPLTPRQKAYRELAPILRTLDADSQESVLRQIAEWAGVERRVRDSHRTLRPEEVPSLNAGGLVEIGAHTVTHPVLSARPRDAQQHEIRLSKQRLEELLNHPVTTFAYPFGARGDYTAESVEIVREAGFARACSNFQGWVRRDTSSHELPRYLVRDWDGDTFSREIAGWYAS
jgi:peptidoglycan/xylan/chitin deacetylase (PgdA/CDA1 family)